MVDDQPPTSNPDAKKILGFDHKTFLKNLTSKPGVYQMYDKNGAILYVGKAKNLKKRVSSYFRGSGLTTKTVALVSRIHNIEITVAPSEAEALVLEHNLIKAQKPPFNILLRDDKSFPYIYLSDGEDHPRLSLHRGSKKKRGRYFGPFPNVSAVRESLNFLQKVFGVRQCEDSVYRNRTRPCLLYQIERCSGPCVNKISDHDYAADVEQTALFLEGKNDNLHQSLVTLMERASSDLHFEQAAIYRDRITALRQVQAQQVMEAGQRNMDIIACAIAPGASCVHRLYVRQGRVVGSKNYYPKNKLDNSEADILSAFVSHSYLGDSGMDVPPYVVLSHPIPDAQALAEAIELHSHRKIQMTANVRTYRAKWLVMAEQAAKLNLQARLNSAHTLEQRYEALQEALAADETPGRIECFDISHSSGESTVASCVVFDQNGPVKSDYRRFNITDITAGDDYAAMEQALNRRYSRLQKEGKQLPGLLLIDGGKGQLSKARHVMAELGIQEVELIGVAKGTTRKPGFETLIRADGSEMILASDSPALHLIQQVRDEAHRFAITGHKQRRDQKRRTSTLENIPGIGPKRRKELLQFFGGLQEVMRASADDLAKVPSISKKMAEEVYTSLHSE
ncbi:excinuclease ABC subunit UvrC [Teredinibacter haidensis]|uniref:excinuclease ABC subunit UvrC n=1 Tax=Teredinibacter haidensis TaxID=2731755 RepID=UPI00094919CD|nr:excinuclease ABC subunit UvrC [Teredinibacter haidensis]